MCWWAEPCRWRWLPNAEQRFRWPPGAHSWNIWNGYRGAQSTPHSAHNGGHRRWAATGDRLITICSVGAGGGVEFCDIWLCFANMHKHDQWLHYIYITTQSLWHQDIFKLHRLVMLRCYLTQTPTSSAYRCANMERVFTYLFAHFLSRFPPPGTADMFLKHPVLQPWDRLDLFPLFNRDLFSFESAILWMGSIVSGPVWCTCSPQRAAPRLHPARGGRSTPWPASDRGTWAFSPGNSANMSTHYKRCTVQSALFISVLLCSTFKPNVI